MRYKFSAKIPSRKGLSAIYRQEIMLTPPEVIDSVVDHELCHRKEMDHSDKFYAEVIRVFPNYWECDKWLKENGNILMTMMSE